MDNQREYINTEAKKLFLKFGIKSVTMDDIARHLGMSKKTIYANFRDKNELVTELIKGDCHSDECRMEHYMTESQNAVEENFLMMDFLREMLKEFNPIVLHDLEKYHTEAFHIMNDFHEKHIYETVKANLERGISEGLFRPDINVHILACARTQQINWVLRAPEIRTGRFSMYELIMELTEHFLYGVCTLKGHKLINEYKQVKEEE